MCMSMESPGTEAVKRQRLDSYGTSVRFPPLGQEGLTQHEYPGPGSIQPPPTYNHAPLPYTTNPSPQQASLPLRDQHQQYDQKNGSFGGPNQERLPPVDTNPLHGVGHPPVSLSPGGRSTPALRPIETSFSEAQSYMQHPPIQGTPPAYASQGPPPIHPPSTPNGAVYHTHPLPMAPSSYEQSQPHSTAPPYSDVHGPPFSAGPYGPHGPVPWRNHYPPQPPPIPPKKGSRATQACETCRQRKAKCDEGKPTCSYCKETRVTCVYKEMQPAKADRAQREIMDALKKTDDNYHNMRDDFSKLTDKVDKVESYLKSLSTIASYIESLKPSGNHVQGDSMIEADSLLDSADAHSASQVYEEMTLQRMQSTENMVSKMEVIPRNPVLTAGHTVMAHRLLHWRSVKELLAGKSLEDDYVMAFEERKGILRLYGKGQGRDSYDGALSGTASSPASSASDEMVPRSPRDPTSQDSCWGDLTLGKPNLVDGKFFQNEKHHLGGLTRTGGLQLDKKTMYSLMESYLSNIHILHPILDRIRLRRMVEKVWRDYNPVEAAGNKSPFLSNTQFQHGGPVMKRKYSFGGTSPEDKKAAPVTNGIHTSTESLPRRTSTVIVLLVMALGKICQYKDPLPGFAPVFEGSSSSTMQTMSPITNSSSPLTPSELRGITGLKTGLTSATFNAKGMRKGDRNVDVVPGLAYFATATSILGTLQGNDLAFAQAYLLAALYTAQLACVLESWTWINNACRVCCFLVRDPSFSKEKDMKRVDLTRFVYLASLQLESDILAEFDLQPSVLQDIDPDGKIGVPYGVVEDAIDIEVPSQPDDVLLYYTYQLSLRKCMNDWQRHLYPVSRGDEEIDINAKGRGNYSIDDRNHCEETLTTLRNLMQKHPELAWEETDEPSSYINAARLRGKYYGAKYFIHRPFLRYALHTFTKANLNSRVMERYWEFAKDPSNYKLEPAAPIGLSKDDLNDWWSLQFLISCHLCVEAAKKSTLAFDGVLKEQRLMITNLFGTAHAQFGNMLVLCAVYSSRLLDFLVDEQELKRLLERTIQFLHSLAPISTTLAKDCELLTVIREKIEKGFKITDNIHTSTTFGSNMRFV